MIYCSCGGQKNCFKCDGKGWIDEPEVSTKYPTIRFPPVLKEYSLIPDPTLEKIDFSRRKPLIAQVKPAGPVPRSSSNEGAKRAKIRKQKKAERKIERIEILNKTKLPTANKKSNPQEAHQPASLTNEQYHHLEEYRRKSTKFIKALPRTGRVTKEAKIRIQDEGLEIREDQIKAQKPKKNQEPPCAPSQLSKNDIPSNKSSQLLKSLFDPSIKEFVDWKKFLASPKFIEISQEQIDHFVKYGDFSQIVRILYRFRGSKSFKPILLWFCDSAGLDFSFRSGEFVLKRASGVRSKEGDLTSYMAKYSGTATDVEKVSRSMQNPANDLGTSNTR